MSKIDCIVPGNITQAVIYCRKSTNDKLSNSSLNRQRQLCEEFAKKQKILINKKKCVYNDICSAFTGKQEKLHNLVNSIDENTIIFVEDMSRFSRNIENGNSILEKITQKNCSVFFIGDNHCHTKNKKSHKKTNKLLKINY